DSALPPVRRRPRHLAVADLRPRDDPARGGVRRARARRAGGLLVARRRLEPCDRGLDARRGGVVPAGSPTGAGLRRPPLLPAPLRRFADAGGVRRAAAPRARPRHAEPRPARRRRRHDAAGACVGLAAGAGAVRRAWTWWLAWGLFGLVVMLAAATIAADAR